jgi:hypothetical protein
MCTKYSDLQMTQYENLEAFLHWLAFGDILHSLLVYRARERFFSSTAYLQMMEVININFQYLMHQYVSYQLKLNLIKLQNEFNLTMNLILMKV